MEHTALLTDWSGNVSTVLPEATSGARTALGLDERDPWAHLTHGMVLGRTKRSEESERVLRRALELIRALFEATYFVGLRKAGMPEQ